MSPGPSRGQRICRPLIKRQAVNHNHDGNDAKDDEGKSADLLLWSDEGSWDASLKLAGFLRAAGLDVELLKTERFPTGDAVPGRFHRAFREFGVVGLVIASGSKNAGWVEFELGTQLGMPGDEKRGFVVATDGAEARYQDSNRYPLFEFRSENPLNDDREALMRWLEGVIGVESSTDWDNE